MGIRICSGWHSGWKSWSFSNTYNEKKNFFSFPEKTNDDLHSQLANSKPTASRSTRPLPEHDRQALKTGLGPLTKPVPAARGWAGLTFTLRTSIVLLRYWV